MYVYCRPRELGEEGRGHYRVEFGDVGEGYKLSLLPRILRGLQLGLSMER